MTDQEIAAKAISDECDALKAFLLDKNASYGNSAFNPTQVFSKLDAKARLEVRMDDKFSRLAKGKEYQGDDTKQDLMGYLLIYFAYDRYMQYQSDIDK